VLTTCAALEAMPGIGFRAENFGDRILPAIRAFLAKHGRYDLIQEEAGGTASAALSAAASQARPLPHAHAAPLQATDDIEDEEGEDEDAQMAAAADAAERALQAQLATRGSNDPDNGDGGSGLGGPWMSLSQLGAPPAAAAAAAAAAHMSSQTGGAAHSSSQGLPRATPALVPVASQAAAPLSARARGSQASAPGPLSTPDVPGGPRPSSQAQCASLAAASAIMQPQWRGGVGGGLDGSARLPPPLVVVSLLSPEAATAAPGRPPPPPPAAAAGAGGAYRGLLAPSQPPGHMLYAPSTSALGPSQSAPLHPHPLLPALPMVQQRSHPYSTVAAAPDNQQRSLAGVGGFVSAAQARTVLAKSNGTS
jgi:hypothetical protein